MKELIIDSKFSVRYDPDNNDRPVRVMRYGEAHDDFEGLPNWVLSMFYALLLKSAPD